MSHEPKIVEVRQLNNSEVTYKIRCCDDPMEESWHTMNVEDEDHDSKLKLRKAEVAKRHEAMERWRAKYSK